MEFDCSDDHLVWDGVETITYFEKTEEAPPASGYTVKGTLWLAIRKDQLKADSLLAKMDLTVELARNKLLEAKDEDGETVDHEIVPKIDDIMRRENGTRWIVKLVEFVAHQNQYRVHVQMSRRGV